MRFRAKSCILRGAGPHPPPSKGGGEQVGKFLIFLDRIYSDFGISLFYGFQSSLGHVGLFGLGIALHHPFEQVPSVRLVPRLQKSEGLF
jgi:hypothetical protein